MKLLEVKEGETLPSEENLEMVAKLMTTVGRQLEKQAIMKKERIGKEDYLAYFNGFFKAISELSTNKYIFPSCRIPLCVPVSAMSVMRDKGRGCILVGFRFLLAEERRIRMCVNGATLNPPPPKDCV